MLVMARPVRSKLSILKRIAVGLFTADTSADMERMLVGIFPGTRGDPPPRSTGDFLKAFSTMSWLRAVIHKVAPAVASTCWQLFAITSRDATDESR
jgi:hypothetical protein